MFPLLEIVQNLSKSSPSHSKLLYSQLLPGSYTYPLARRGMSKDKRNLAIDKAFGDGYTQASIANELGLTPAMVSYVIRNLRFDTSIPIFHNL